MRRRKVTVPHPRRRPLTWLKPSAGGYKLPENVLAECRERALTLESKPVSRIGAALVITLWLALAAAGIWILIEWRA